MSELTDFLKNQRNVHFQEGFCEQIKGQVELLKKIGNEPNIKNIMEIGFNGGHSANLFLSLNPDIKVTSFDLGEHSYVYPAKEWIDNKYPSRHNLILGDSRSSIPTFIRKNPTKFDLIFIDGGHQGDIPALDIINCQYLAHIETIVIVDDTVLSENYQTHWTIQPTEAWKKFVNNGLISQMDSVEFEVGRGMSWGKYNISV
jgi:predicted O-methyltransferase YrrM